MDDPNVIREAFSYTREEQEVFPYLRNYMCCINKHLPGILSDDKKRLRFMLAGLFLTYRMCNHTGLEFKTHNNFNSVKAVHNFRVNTYEKAGGPPINSASDYLKLLNFGIFKLFCPGIGKRLCKFVLKG